MVLIKLIKEEKGRLVLASFLIFLSGISEIFTGYLNGSAVEAITDNRLKAALVFLGIYFLLEITLDGIVIHKANSVLYDIENLLTRKLGFNTYVKALNLPAASYEKHSSGEIVNRITNDADSLSFAFKSLKLALTNV